VCVCVREREREKDHQDAHYFLYLFHLSYPVHVSNKQFDHQAITSVRSAYSILHAAVVIKIMLIIYIYIVTESINIFVFCNVGFLKCYI
jgi:hypothetical protein